MWDGAMGTEIIQRFAWEGQPRALAVWWTLRKRGPHRAVCTHWTHPLGHELRLEIMCNLVRSRVCQSDEEILDTQSAWRMALEVKGWMGREMADVSGDIIDDA